MSCLWNFFLLCCYNAKDYTSESCVNVGQTGRDLRGGVFKQAVIRIEHLLGEEEEPLSGHAAVVKSFLRLKLDPQPRLQDVGPL